MKHLIASLSLLMALIGLAHSEEIIVTPKNPNGWVFGVQGSSKTVSWLLGYNRNAPNLGTGDYWMYTGECDGVPYAETDAFKGVPLASITRIGYDTFTPTIPGRGDIQIAPEMRIYLDVPGKPNGFYLQYSPGLQGNVPTGRWTSWNPLLGKWYNNQDGSGVVLPLAEWVAQYQNATLKNLRIYAGTISKDPNAHRIFSRWQMGVDNVSFSYALNSIVVYNFESDPMPAPEQTDKPIAKPLFETLFVNPLVIVQPSYYILYGDIINNETINNISQNENKAKELDPKPSKPDVYSASDGVYVPVVFKGNTTLKKVLSQLNNVGNPDETIKRGEVKVTEGGAFLFGGVPFYVPENNNTWDANDFQDDNEHKLVAPVKMSGVLEIKTIMGLTYATGATGTTFLEFRGSNGAFYRKELVVNKDIRDMRTSKFSTIVPPTVVVWSRPLMQLPKQEANWEMFLDMQTVTLPSEFLEQDLVSITVVDKGKHNAQRSFLAGLTIKIKSKKFNK